MAWRTSGAEPSAAVHSGLADRARLDDPALEAYRWMLEELRVSLFAQELGTSIPVSAKRLQKQWEKVS